MVANAMWLAPPSTRTLLAVKLTGPLPPAIDADPPSPPPAEAERTRRSPLKLALNPLAASIRAPVDTPLTSRLPPLTDTDPPAVTDVSSTVMAPPVSETLPVPLAVTACERLRAPAAARTTFAAPPPEAATGPDVERSPARLLIAILPPGAALDAMTARLPELTRAMLPVETFVALKLATWFGPTRLVPVPDEVASAFASINPFGLSLMVVPACSVTLPSVRMRAACPMPENWILSPALIEISPPAAGALMLLPMRALPPVPPVRMTSPPALIAMLVGASGAPPVVPMSAPAPATLPPVSTTSPPAVSSKLCAVPLGAPMVAVLPAPLTVTSPVVVMTWFAPRMRALLFVPLAPAVTVIPPGPTTTIWFPVLDAICAPLPEPDEPPCNVIAAALTC